MRFCGVLMFLAILGGCARDTTEPGSVKPPGRSTYRQPKAGPWKLICIDPKAETPALLWNGKIGIRLSRSANGVDADGKPLPFLMIDEYETAGEEKIRVLPNPVQIVADNGSNELFTALQSNVRGYRQELDMRTGILSTVWNEDSGGARIDVDVQTAIHPTQKIIVQRWTLQPDKEADVAVSTAGTDFPGRRPYTPGKVETFTGLGASGVKWSLLERQISDGKGGKPVVAEFTWTFGMSPLFVKAHGHKMDLAQDWAEPPAAPTFDAVAKASRDAWAKRWETDIEIDGPVEDQQAIRSFLFYLQGSIAPDNLHAVSPLALSGDTYFGHVFWDADIWVFPALALVAPDLARTIPLYRLSLQSQYRKNFQEWLAAGRPTARGKMGESLDALEGLMVPWESSVTGKETVPGPSRFQHHITGTAAFAMANAAALGLVPEKEAERFIEGARGFFAARSDMRRDGLLEIADTMSPDEHHTGDNDLYTNLLGLWLQNGGRWPTGGAADSVEGSAEGVRPAGPKSGKSVAYYLPRDEKTFLSYDGDLFRGYKQAAAVLAIYPLQFPPAEREARAMMERFEGKVIKNGPAMTDSIHALIWARLGETERAYEVWRRSWQEFTGHPLLLFSEKRKHDVTYFTTGAGGCLQTVLYGFLGLRLDTTAQEGAVWSRRLADGKVLSAKPRLPKAWKSVRFKGRLGGEKLSLAFGE